MDDYSSIVTSACKAMRSVGYPKKRERRLEAHVRTILKHEGSEGLLQRFKALQAIRIDEHQVDPSFDTRWIAFTRSGLNPKNRAERELWSLSDPKFFQVSGAVIMSVTRDIRSKDVDKWYSDMSQVPLSPTQGVDLYLRDEKAQDVIRHNSYVWDAISEKLIDNLQEQPHFSVNDVTKSAIPLGPKVHHMTFKENRNHERVVDDDDLLQTYRDTMRNVPDFEERHMYYLSRLYMVQSMMFDTVSDYEKLSQANGQLPNKSNLESYQYLVREQHDFHTVKDGIRYSYGKPRPSLNPKGRAMHSDRPIVGTISFLPKPGGKARVVANPNRRLQHSVDALGLAIQDTVYNDVRYANHIFVMDQDKGRKMVSNSLSAGDELASVDLSSATDTMDYNSVLRVTGFDLWQERNHESIEHGRQMLEKAHKIFMKIEPAVHSLPYQSNDILRDIQGSFPVSKYAKDEINEVSESYTDIKKFILYDKMTEFNEIRTGSFQLDVGTDSREVPTPIDAVSFDRGQPLGTRPSFPLLTFANVSLGTIATSRASNTTTLGVVGDDIVMSSSAYFDYRDMMNSMGCTVNEDKTLVSSKLAEFVGYLHTPDRIYPKKPRVSKSEIDNAVKFGITPKRAWLKPILDEAVRGMVYDFTSLSSTPQSDKTLRARYSSNESTYANKVLADRYVKAIDDHSSSRDSKTITGDTMVHHISALDKTRPEDMFTAPEEHISDMHYSHAIKFFDHNDMDMKTARESLYKYFNKKKLIGDIAEELTSTHTAIIPSGSPDVLWLADDTGHVATVTPHSWEDFQLSDKSYDLLSDQGGVKDENGLHSFQTVDKVAFKANIAMFVRNRRLPDLDPVQSDNDQTAIRKSRKANKPEPRDFGPDGP